MVADDYRQILIDSNADDITMRRARQASNGLRARSLTSAVDSSRDGSRPVLP
jgi:activator of HSP90 ATPase